MTTTRRTFCFPSTPTLTSTPLLTSTVSTTSRRVDVTTRITDYDFTVALNRTEIGDVNVGRVHVMLDIAMVTAVLQRLNQLGQRGVRLPMIKHVSYGQPLMTLYDECVFVGENVTYTPVLLKAKYNPT